MSNFLLYHCGALLILGLSSFIRVVFFIAVSLATLTVLDFLVILRKAGVFPSSSGSMDAVEIVTANVVILLVTAIILKELQWKERSLRFTFLNSLVIDTALLESTNEPTSFKTQALTIRAGGTQGPPSTSAHNIDSSPNLIVGANAAVNKAFPKLDQELTIRLDQVPQFAKGKPTHPGREKNLTQTLNLPSGILGASSPVGIHHRTSSGFLNVKPFTTRGLSQRRTARGLAEFLSPSRDTTQIEELNSSQERGSDNLFGVKLFSAFAGHMDHHEMRWIKKKGDTIEEGGEVVRQEGNSRSTSPVLNSSPANNTTAATATVAATATATVPTDANIIPNPNQLLTMDEIPSYVSGYQYILNGYRSEMTVCEATKSMFKIHNEVLCQNFKRG
ncbi:hypothetical protein RFI_22854 [Reticulomyxa filosa]|uniref:Uncharacterized protein n=1 Tax=Reticulomyxa filosa TaxID=46433 RepID=X6MKZ2_RETFI|nr:hypothetical protein RFI_22854 [Reticulomyxa filosa]|eukprot:ETO14514.1 hypothetical protein RFI_22854 [Reticulomyxa filosa]